MNDYSLRAYARKLKMDLNTSISGIGSRGSPQHIFSLLYTTTAVGVMKQSFLVGNLTSRESFPPIIFYFNVM
jgi:hypothetical protein